MTCLVQIINFGSRWWLRPGACNDDPERFTRRAAIFNTTGIVRGSKVCQHWRVPGVIRFNGESGLDPHRPLLAVGKVFSSAGIERFGKWNRLLVLGPANVALHPTHFICCLSSQIHGAIDYGSTWRSNDARLIACSERQREQQSLLLLTIRSMISTSYGQWMLRWNSEMGKPLLALVDPEDQ